MPGRTPAAALPSLRARAERLMDERTRSLAGRARADAAQDAAHPVLSVIACALGDEFYGLPLAMAAHVLPAAPCVPLPGAPPAMLGLLGRTGQVFSVLDLGLALGRPAARPEAASDPALHGRMMEGHVVLLRHAPRRFALRVDRVLGVAEVAPLQQPGQPVAERMVAGHAWLPPALAGGRRPVLGLIDMDRLLQPYLSSPETFRSVTP